MPTTNEEDVLLVLSAVVHKGKRPMQLYNVRSSCEKISIDISGPFQLVSTIWEKSQRREIK